MAVLAWDTHTCAPEKPTNLVSLSYLNKFNVDHKVKAIGFSLAGIARLAGREPENFSPLCLAVLTHLR